jgi:putative membrane-bound dehydrogenase-like protein
MHSLLLLAAALPAATPLPKAPPGFKVELVLEAPAIEAPTALCVAPNGDVYFAEDPMDMRGPPTKNLDRIWLLKGGDPHKKILFAENMWAVMGLELVGDKLYCVNAPHVTVFTLNADGTAKSRSDLFDDLGPPVAGVPSFNDHIPSGIRMGMDGYLYVSIGDKGIPKMTRKETDRGSVHVAEGRWRHSKEGHHISLEGGGVIRFRPDGSNLEVFASGTRNHLDVPMDEHDRIFVRDNTDDGLGWNTRLMYLPRGGFLGYPWAYTKRPAECLPMIHDFGGGSPCGGWVYCDDGLPALYRGRIFHCEWGQGKVYAVKVAPDGAGFKYVDQITFLDPTGTGLKDFRPFTLRPTADGRGFYVTDWGHSGWLQPVKAGRIYKVTYTGDDVKPAPRGKDTDSVEQLIAALGHPALTERIRAQRILVQKGRQVANEFTRQLQRHGGPESVTARRHLVWVMSSVAPREAAKWAFGFWWNQSVEVRAEVLRMLSEIDVSQLPEKTEENNPGRDALREMVKDSLKDERDATLRLNAAIACRPLLDAGLAEDLLVRLVHEPDRFVRLTIVNSLRKANWKQLSSRLTPEVLRLEIPERAALFQGLFAETFEDSVVTMLAQWYSTPIASTRQVAIQTLARNYKDRKPYAGTWWGTQPARNPPPKREVAWEGTPTVRDAVVKALGDPAAEVRKAAVAALVEWADPETLPPLRTRFAAEKDAGNRLDLVRAVAGMKSPAAADFLAGVLGDRSFSRELREAALAGLPGTKAANADEALAKIATADEPVELRGLALRTLGEMKSSRARLACDACLKSTRSPQIVEAAMKALASLGDSTAGPLVLPELANETAGVRKAAIETAAALKLRAAVLELLRLSRDKETEFEALTALAAMPDARALSAYLTGLGSKNTTLRTACRNALVGIREAAAPTLEELAKRNELPPGVISELREVYGSYAPVTNWKLIGPFEGREKSYPPETEQRFGAIYDGVEKKVRWRDAHVDPKTGRVNLVGRFSPSENVCAYGFAEINSDRDRDARLRIGSDDTFTVWLNGAKVYEFTESRGWAPDQATVPVHLSKGTNRLLVKCGNYGGPWEFSVAVSGDVDRYAFLHGGPAKFDLDAFRKHARQSPGDAGHGQKLFLDVKGLACVKCHAVGGQGGLVGPDLAGIGLKYNREDLMTSILEPSKVIAQGYETVNVYTKSGKTLIGVFKGETADAIRLADAEGKEHVVPKSDIEEKNFSPVSVMPNGLSDGMTLQDFADVIAFLEARKEKK